MTYEAWLISYQSSEQAARAAYAECEQLRARRKEMKIEKIPEGYLLAKKGGNGCELWRTFNDAESIASQAIDELIAERDALRAENAALVDDMNLLRDNNTALRAKIAEMEKQRRWIQQVLRSNVESGGQTSQG